MSARISLSLSLPLLSVALCSAGCDDSLKSVSLIEETRVLGARVEVESDETRSSPNPGERAGLHFFVVAPNGDPQFSSALSVCAVQLTNDGFPPCASALFASAVQAEATSARAQLDFQVPAELDLASTPHAFASGLICPDSGLDLGPDGASSCRVGKGIEVAFELDLGGPGQSNRSPTFAGNALSLDGEPWPASSDVTCDGSSLRQVTTRTSHVLQIELADSDFEPLTPLTAADPVRETLLVSPFATAGKLGHGFLALSADTKAAERQVSWEAPALADGLATLVHFYFVVRDARGGEDFAERALCVVP